MLRLFTTLIIPIALLIAAIFIYPETKQLYVSQRLMVKWLPYGLALIVLLLSLRFNRSRMLFSALTVVSAYAVMQYFPAGAGKAGFSTLWAALCMLLPLNMVVFSLLKERGTFTLWGSTRLALLATPFAIITGIAQWYPVDIQNLFFTDFVNKELVSGLHFPQLALFMMALSLLLLNGRMFARPGAQNGAMFVGLVAAIIMLHFKSDALAGAVFASSIMLIFLVAVIQESWSMAYIDQLTNLPGRRALDEEILKLGGSYSIAMLDIDHFKKFNDRHGHDAGDQVLNMVASRIKQSVSGGKAFRYGGEEFTIVFSGKDIEDAMDVLEDVRKSVSSQKFQLRQARDRRKVANKKKRKSKNVKVTISIGVASRSERLVSTAEVIKSADKALYRAKKQGRNRVCK